MHTPCAASRTGVQQRGFRLYIEGAPSSGLYLKVYSTVTQPNISVNENPVVSLSGLRSLGGLEAAGLEASWLMLLIAFPLAQSISLSPSLSVSPPLSMHVALPDGGATALFFSLVVLSLPLPAVSRRCRWFCRSSVVGDRERLGLTNTTQGRHKAARHRATKTRNKEEQTGRET